ncbi:MAG TPA: DUF3572 family protein [Rhizobiales bacterium]|nr:DUF3572 family protein [Hyphomicrobiales bacterium]
MKNKSVFPDMDGAENLALAALRFVAADRQYWSEFETMSGITPDMVAELAGERGFLSGILDYLLSSDSLLLAFTGNAAIAPQEVTNARHVLAGDIPTQAGEA